MGGFLGLVWGGFGCLMDIGHSNCDSFGLVLKKCADTREKSGTLSQVIGTISIMLYYLVSVSITIIIDKNDLRD